MILTFMILHSSKRDEKNDVIKTSVQETSMKSNISEGSIVLGWVHVVLHTLFHKFHKVFSPAGTSTAGGHTWC